MSRLVFLVVFLFAHLSSALAQWQIEESHTTADLRGIHALGNGIAWASGTEGTVLRTTDDGADWQRCANPPGAEALDFRGIQAFDAETAVVMSSGKGDLSRVYKTADGCQTWKLVFTNPDAAGSFDAMNFFAPSHDLLGNPMDPARVLGYLLGDPVGEYFTLFSTGDGGTTWSRRTATKRGPKGEGCKIDSFSAKDKQASFSASNQSLLSFAPYFVFITGGSIARLAYTNHFDLDFALCHDSARFIDLPLAHGNPSSGAFAIAVEDQHTFPPLKLMIVGGDYKLPNSSTHNAVIVSGLGTFFPRTSEPATPPHGYRSAVAYDNATKTWITVGPNGTDISTDDGRNWRALKPSGTDTPDADRNWNALSLPFVVGPHGRIGKFRAKTLSP